MHQTKIILIFLLSLFMMQIPLVFAGLTFTDPYTDDSYIASSTQTEVTGGQVQLDTYFLDPLLDNFTACQKLTIDSTKIEEELTDFPILVHLDSDNIDWSKVQDDLDDLRFTTDNVSYLSYEIDSFVTNDWANLWVNIPTVTDGSDTDLFMFYNDPEAVSGEDITNTWNTGYVFVHHLTDETTSSVLDSTSNNHDGTKGGANEPLQQTGIVGYAQDFDGSNDKITLPNHDDFDVNLADSFTVECWIQADATGSGTQTWPLIGKYSGVCWNLHLTQTATWFQVVNVDLSLQSTSWNLLQTDTIPPNTWYYICGTYNGSHIKLYIDAVSNPSPTAQTGNVRDFTSTLDLGWDDQYDRFSPLDLDEVRLSFDDRSDAWLKATYETCLNQLVHIGDVQESGERYYSIGTSISTNLLQGLNVTSITSFNYNCSLNSQEILFSFSQDLTNWYNTTQKDGWNSATEGTHTMNLKTLGWSGGFFYYRANMTTTDPEVTPELYLISVDYETDLTDFDLGPLALILAIVGIAIAVLFISRR